MFCHNHAQQELMTAIHRESGISGMDYTSMEWNTGIVMPTNLCIINILFGYLDPWHGKTEDYQ